MDINELSEMWELAFGASSDSISFIDCETQKYVNINTRFTQLFGFTEQEAVGKTSIELDLWPDPREGRRVFAKLDAGREIIERKMNFKAKDGTLRPCLLTAKVVKTYGERRIMAIVRDITDQLVLANEVEDRKKAELALHQSEARFKDFTDASSDWVWEMGPDLRFTYFSDSIQQHLGISPTAGIGKKRGGRTDMGSAHEDWAANLGDLKNHRPFSNFRYRFFHPNGKVYYLRINGKPIFDETGAFIGYRGTGSNITNEVAAEEAMAESEAKFREIYNLNPDGFAITNQKSGVFVDVNEAFTAIMGYRKDEVIGQSSLNISTWARSEDRGRLVAALAKHGLVRNLDVDFRRKDGTIFPALMSAAIISLRGVPHILSSIKDVTEFQQARREADKANKAKSEFLSSMSHELRTPLNSILGFGQLLESSQTNPLDAAQLKQVEYIIKGGEHLLSLINEILDLAKIESGSMVLSLEPVSPCAVVEESLELLKPLAAKAGIRLVNKVNEEVGLPDVHADFTRMKQALVNLLSNAIKYNRPQGMVTLSAEVRPPGTVRLNVADTGTGIPKEKIGELFLPFSRLGAENSNIEGTGIGLALTRDLTAMMGGKVAVKSMVGIGSTFSLDLPIASESGGKNLPKESDPSNREINRLVEKKTTVLYIEDNPVNVLLMEDIFAKFKLARLVTAHTAELGIELAQIRLPSLILLDINLPGMNGFQALRCLRGLPETKHIPVIALSAHVMPKDLEEGRKAGFADYVTKPLKIDRLVNAINLALAEVRPGAD